MELNVNTMAAQVMAGIREDVKAERKNAENLIRDLSDATLQKVKEKSPVRKKAYPKGSRKRPGRYRKGWAVEKRIQYGVTQYVVLNEKEPRLTHILENGTAQRETKKGKRRGRVKKTPHIRPAFDEEVAKFEKRL